MTIMIELGGNRRESQELVATRRVTAGHTNGHAIEPGARVCFRLQHPDAETITLVNSGDNSSTDGNHPCTALTFESVEEASAYAKRVGLAIADDDDDDQ